jgi:phosphatidate cytidylyltransferase
MKRILTALVALPILLYTVWSLSPYPFVAITALAVILALGEFYHLASEADCQPTRALGYLAALLVILCFVLDKPVWTVAIFAALVIASLAAGLTRAEYMKRSLASAGATVLGVSYVALLAGFLAGVRMIPDPPGLGHLASKLITLFLAMVMMTDTGAYYTGRAMGRHKLAPRISPGKTVEGAVGGFIAAVIAGPLCRVAFFSQLPLLDSLLLGASIGILSQVGDLAESMLKRGSGVKDSSHLLPGHGGMLDRLDSILFCAPLIYYYSRFFTPAQ